MGDKQKISDIVPEDLVINQLGLGEPHLSEFVDYARRLLAIVNDDSLTYSERKLRIRGLASGYVEGLDPKPRAEIADGISKIHSRVIEIKNSE